MILQGRFNFLLLYANVFLRNGSGRMLQELAYKLDIIPVIDIDLGRKIFSEAVR